MGKKEKICDNKINVPLHIINQLRKVNGEIKGKTMDIEENTHENQKEVRTIMKNNDGILIADSTILPINNQYQKADGNGQVQRIVKSKQIDKMLDDEEKEIAFVAFKAGNQKISVHTFGSIKNFKAP